MLLISEVTYVTRYGTIHECISSSGYKKALASESQKAYSSMFA